jgi:hypothetical protein
MKMAIQVVTANHQPSIADIKDKFGELDLYSM